MRIVVSGAARLAVDDIGDPLARVLLLLHAGNATRVMWEPLLAPLSARHRVVRYDARGFGDSSPADAPYLGSDDVIAVLDALGVARATVIRASLGGRVALDAALAAPERIAAVAMIGSLPSGATVVFTDAEQRLADAADEAEAAGDWDRRAELEVDIWSVGPSRRRDQVDPAFLARSIQDAHERVALLRSAPGRRCVPGTPPAIGRLDELAAPLLSLVGEHDFAFTRAQHERTSAAVGGAAAGAIIPDAAHFPSVEQPEAVLDVVLPWLEAHTV